MYVSKVSLKQFPAMLFYHIRFILKFRPYLYGDFLFFVSRHQRFKNDFLLLYSFHYNQNNCKNRQKSAVNAIDVRRLRPHGKKSLYKKFLKASNRIIRIHLCGAGGGRISILSAEFRLFLIVFFFFRPLTLKNLSCLERFQKTSLKLSFLFRKKLQFASP